MNIDFDRAEKQPSKVCYNGLTSYNYNAWIPFLQARKDAARRLCLWRVEPGPSRMPSTRQCGIGSLLFCTSEAWTDCADTDPNRQRERTERQTNRNEPLAISQ